MRLLDSDVLTDIRRRFPPAVAWLSGLSERPGLPGLVVLELIDGCRNQREVQSLLRQVAAFRIYWPTTEDQERALDTFARAHFSHNLGLLDALIGECATGLAAVLCTFNVRHYRAMPQLRTEQPYVRI